MAVAQFEEKEYEQAAGVELAEGPPGEQGLVFSAGQVLERIVGYDAAAAPARRHVIWRLLELPRPRGLRLVPNLWSPARVPPAERLPGVPVSLIVQFKRPEFLRGPRAAQWWLCHQPYFRFIRTSHQHAVLLRLERRLGHEAVVRYAAPAFWRRGELEAAHLHREVLARTGFASPSDFGRHQVWTYLGPGIDGRGNPEGRRKPFKTFDAVAEQLWSSPTSSTELVPMRGLDDHLLFLGDVVTERQPRLRAALSKWALQLREADLPLSHRTQQLVVALTAVVTLTSDVHASWWVTGRGANELTGDVSA
jgi:hypothetical protein